MNKIELLESKSYRELGIDKGWYGIGEKLYDKLIEWEQRGEQLNYPISLFQIKQKFGGLRIYIERGISFDELNEQQRLLNDEIDDFINELEKEAATTCERCGIQNETVKCSTPDGYWIVNVCDKCKQQLQLECK